MVLRGFSSFLLQFCWDFFVSTSDVVLSTISHTMVKFDLMGPPSFLIYCWDLSLIWVMCSPFFFMYGLEHFEYLFDS